MNGNVAPPIESEVNMDKDYDYYIAKYNSQPQQAPTRNTKYQGNLGAVPMEPVSEQRPMGTPPRPPAVTPTATSPGKNDEDEPGAPGDEVDQVEGDDALLDLAQLEELHHEAERMKALGNKHMAAQEYTRAYNAYSAALQLSPVGPSSHVFLSNRSAALLSLKRYSAAATDARRAIALAPTFGKAHARLGQSLYFLKDYAGAVDAYEDAIHYEPDNPITRTYLEKAKIKLQRQKEKAARASRGEEVSVLTTESSVQATVINSVATDPNASAAVVQSMGFRGQSNAMANAVGGGMGTMSVSSGLDNTIPEDDDDPDFDEALRIQERANKYLANKNYKYAIEEYTAALFLVPDDDNLSPDLHLGRAHGLNGSRRHESAVIDAKLAIKIKPTPEAYSTLAKSLFYLKDYQGAVDAFGKCKEMLPEGEALSMFDRAYLQKSETALQEALVTEQASLPTTTSRSPHSNSSAPIPKLKPPRFVPREEALSRAPTMPSMPKAWPQQSPKAAQVLQCGPEREVLFLSEALGIKLNRGPDGVVRVIDVSPDVPGSPIARQGQIAIGDVVREAAGVDIRRPITNIMWGDTVALIKMAPRPIVLTVAQELNPAGSIVNQRKQAAAKALSPTSSSHFFPSNASGEESVKELMKNSHATNLRSVLSSTDGDTGESHESTASDVKADDALLAELDTLVESKQGSEDDQKGLPSGNLLDQAAAEDIVADPGDVDAESATADQSKEVDDKLSDTATRPAESQDIASENEKLSEETGNAVEQAIEIAETAAVDAAAKPSEDMENAKETGSIQKQELKKTEVPPASHPPIQSDQGDVATLRDKEYARVGGEIYFLSNAGRNYSGWDNLRFMSFSGTRKVRYCEPVSRFIQEKRTLFWSGEQFVPRKLAVYDEPNIILILRAPDGLPEMREILGLPVGANVENPKQVAKSYLVVESVIDPSASKLRLSPLTTATSFFEGIKDPRRNSCFTIISPTETVVLSAVRLRKGAERALTSFSDSGAFLETSTAEHALKQVICKANDPDGGLEDLSWKHQIILGTLHSFVVLANQPDLDRSLETALRRANMESPSEVAYLDSRVIDQVDESGRTPLHYACLTRFSSAVAALVKYGANVDVRTEPNNMTPCHLCAMNLDDKSLSTLLDKNRRPNVQDKLGRTPMSLAIVEGRTVNGQRNAKLLKRCIEVLDSHGAEIDTSGNQRHPVSYLASLWLNEELAAVLGHVDFRYPILPSSGDGSSRIGISVDAFFHYPVHSCLVAFRERVRTHIKNVAEGRERQGWDDSAQSGVLKTLETLLSSGFEPNERLEGLSDPFEGCEGLLNYIGFAPVQILAGASLDALESQKEIGEKEYLAMEVSISNIFEFLVKHGARVNIEPPLEVRRSWHSDAQSAQTNRSTDSIDASTRKIQPMKEFSDVLGSLRMKSAEIAWKSEKPVKSPVTYIMHTDKLPIEDSLAPGGSDEKSCSICWKAFGTIMNRKHRCRIARRHVCDECSTRRVIQDGEEHRVSDGQFLLAKADAKNHRVAPAEKVVAEKKMSATEVRLARLEAEEAANRNSLFGGVMESMSKAVFGETEEGSRTTSDDIQGLSASLGQTRDALNQRGEKLNTLAEKSDKLVEASRDFASMASELNKQSQKGLFW